MVFINKISNLSWIFSASLFHHRKILLFIALPPLLKQKPRGVMEVEAPGG